MDEEILKFLCKNETLKDAYDEGKDLYSTLASILFDCDYEDCLEFRNDEPYVDGYKKRKVAKFLFLGLYFGDTEILKGLLK